MNAWTAVVVAKPWRFAKSRLQTPDRARLARAFTLDVLEAVTESAAVGRVVVVSAERGLVGEARRHQVALVADRPGGTTGGLNSAVSLGWHWAQRVAPHDPVVIVPADLPCLTPEILDVTLATMGRHERAFVPDLARGGTTLVSAVRPVELRSAYGPSSASRHERLGLVRLDGVDHAVRRDVDTLDDLAEARLLGLGPRTSAASADTPVATRP